MQSTHGNKICSCSVSETFGEECIANEEEVQCKGIEISVVQLIQ